jgi:hypothetical protein
MPIRFSRSGEKNQNYSTAVQTPAATVRTYIAGSALQIPAGGLIVGDILRWVVHMTKTAAGTAASTIDVAFGTLGTTADTARLSFTKPAGTAVVDDGVFWVEAVVQSVSATGVVKGLFNLIHNLAATGHAVIPCVVVPITSATFDNSAETQTVGLCITTGAADAITIQQVSAELVRN